MPSGVTNNMSDTLKQQYQIAFQQTLNQGNLNPLVEFYNSNEMALHRKYNISLSQLLDLNQEQLTALGNLGTTVNQPVLQAQREGNLLTDLIYPITAILAGGVGLLLIVKSFKK